MEVRPSFHFIDAEFKQTDNNFWVKMTRITEFVQKSQFRSMRIARSKNEINIVGSIFHIVGIVQKYSFYFLFAIVLLFASLAEVHLFQLIIHVPGSFRVQSSDEWL